MYIYLTRSVKKVEKSPSSSSLNLKLTENKTESVSEWRLTPDQSSRVNSLGRTIDVPPTHPRCCHRKDTDKQADRTASQHDLLLGVVARLLLPRCPYSNAKDQRVEQYDRDKASDVDHLRGVRFQRRVFELTETEIPETWRPVQFRYVWIPARLKCRAMLIKSEISFDP